MDLLEARARVNHLQDLEEELWKQLHPVCRCDQLVELRRGRGQNYHYRCRVDGPLCHVLYYSRAAAWVPYEFCVGTHSANGPVAGGAEGFDEHGGRADEYL